ncbi:M23 family metallopeptidase [Candidatus Formimonas warabiya]|uniref:M23ase beta-sheet core domain-containing protein n=1 Tax=Formimonas warabiya TaxID=1761012 RepID=A0A3G1KU45_FORW1|nr:M23 family metallopeptidase [Candidatus Formimonas warabiya]ATW25972.1 hypothetical protein DCMF_15365 [Candidatus Formimonas warabiya]
MFGNVHKIKDMEINKIWVSFAVLLVLTIAGSAYFVSQRIDRSPVETSQSGDQSPSASGAREEQAAEVGANQVVQEPVQKSAEIPLAGPADETQDIVMRWPGQGQVITGFGFSHSETFNDIRFHSGIDIALPPGYEVRAALPGTVTSIASSPLWGYEIAIKHGEKLETRYKGIKPEKAEPGFTVAKGEIIGSVLVSPKYEAKMAPHLHFEVYEYGKAVDPMAYLH